MKPIPALAQLTTLSKTIVNSLAQSAGTLLGMSTKKQTGNLHGIEILGADIDANTPQNRFEF